MKSVTKVFSDVDTVSGKELEYNIQLYEQLSIQRLEDKLMIALILKNVTYSFELVDFIRVKASPFLSESTRIEQFNDKEEIFKLIYTPENNIKTPSGQAKKNLNHNLSIIKIKALWENIRLSMQRERGMFHKKKDFNPAKAIEKGL